MDQNTTQAINQLAIQVAGLLYDDRGCLGQLPCSCGWTGALPVKRKALVMSVFGRMHYRRADYAGRGCGHEPAPSRSGRAGRHAIAWAPSSQRLPSDGKKTPPQSPRRLPSWLVVITQHNLGHGAGDLFF